MYSPTTRSKLEIAKEAITKLISENPEIDFGLAVFNNDIYETIEDEFGEYQHYYGGHILKGLIRPENTTGLINTVNEIQARTNTPLCDTYYEVFRYLTGQRIFFGNKAAGRDKTQEKDSYYQTPAKICQNVYIIYMTDGEPYKDGYTKSRIEELTGKTCEGNCLPILAEYMATFPLEAADWMVTPPLATKRPLPTLSALILISHYSLKRPAKEMVAATQHQLAVLQQAAFQQTTLPKHSKPHYEKL